MKGATMKHFIITGTSRGIGEAIAYQLRSSGHFLHCISRERNTALISNSENMAYYEFDLVQTDAIEALMERIFSQIDQSQVEGLYLINNASMIAPVAPIDAADSSEITRNIQVNLIAPILLTSLFIKYTRELAAEKRVLNISSASAKNLHPGMSLYSAAKAGLDVFTQSVALEQNNSNAPVKIVSIWPGMIDTSLQSEARSMDRAMLPTVELFKQVMESGMLTTPEETAKQIIAFLFKEDIEHGEVVDIYDYSK
ncbi:(S)-benzoin forming benzil reductase [Paenibacillus lupini]|uniref:(S)-benzoin forming benzil reductase n=1 Tax=Paenibacillus lupini TaxID=1450204 RepID=UPI001FBAAAB3|nr:(S)-benzoin forming benzil reductase [Paenibacillus lupini]NIK21758.1 benzil reductase ((S)-benzoin forming) [Paenibacillus lupini]